ncbi:hypothetical protein ACWDAZ_33315, partial [Streptomyces sp. NPDC001215]
PLLARLTAVEVALPLVAALPAGQREDAVAVRLEEWLLTPAGSGTRVQWTFAADGPGVVLFALRRARGGLGRAFRGAVTALEARLAGEDAGPGSARPHPGRQK